MNAAKMVRNNMAILPDQCGDVLDSLTVHWSHWAAISPCSKGGIRMHRRVFIKSSTAQRITAKKGPHLFHSYYILNCPSYNTLILTKGYHCAILLNIKRHFWVIQMILFLLFSFICKLQKIHFVTFIIRILQA